MAYNFKTQLAIGAGGEARLDRALAGYGVIMDVTMTEQRRGIDRLLLRPGGATVRLEYKTDVKAATTGNVFIELKVGEKMGWIHTTTADRIVWYLPGLEKMVIVPVARLVDNLQFWIDTLPRRTVENVGYRAYGVAVPLAQVEAIASMVKVLEGETDDG